jgi:magnesium-transporting ATPase (P-type)
VGVLVICVLYSEVSLNLTEVFPCFFLSCKSNARVKLAKTGHGPHFSTLVGICVVLFLFVLFYVLFLFKCVLPPGDNPIAVNKYTISYVGLSMHVFEVSLISIFLSFISDLFYLLR